MEEHTSGLENLNHDALLLEIRSIEDKLASLRKVYLARTGELPPRRQRDSDWRWTVFLSLGIAYITFIVYYFGVRQSGIGEGFAIPEFFYDIEVQYFAIFTFFSLVLILNVQQDRIRGYQVFVLFLGFWCAQWFIYDWSWWAMEIGFGHVDLATFWTRSFGAPFLIYHPPMWLFLVESLLGLTVSLYTFTIPHNYKTLAPPLLWLYTIFVNAFICDWIGLGTPITLIIGICLIIIVFGLMGFNIFSKFRGRNKNIGDKDKTMMKSLFSVKKWTLDPLGIPMLPINIVLIALSYLFNVLVPEVGLLMGLLSWFCFPGFVFFLNGTRFARLSRVKKILSVIFMIFVIVGLIVFVSVAVLRLAEINKP